MNKKKFRSFLLLLVISGVILFIYYRATLINPGAYLYNDTSDAIKNYFTYQTQIENNSVIHSDRMNYPYGEHFLYLDCHPAFTMLFKLLSVPFPSIINHSIGFINVFMVLSILISVIFIYLILTELDVHPNFAAFSAFSVAILAPQIFRTIGHFTLSYSFFIPLSWYLYIKFTKSTFKFKWSILISVNILFWYFIHAYLGMIVVAFLVLCYMSDFALNSYKKYLKLLPWVYILIQIIIPFVFFWLFLNVTDNHTGRTDNPYGFFLYTSSVKNVFTPNHPPLGNVMNYFFNTNNPDWEEWEGWSYIGLSSVISCLLIIYYLVRIILKRTSSAGKLFFSNRHLKQALLAGIIILLISMAYPFKLKMEFLLEWFPVIKNFRGIGRFAWIFYYVITISCIYITYNIYCHLRSMNKKWAVILLILVPLSFCIEGYSYHKLVRDTIRLNSNLFRKKQLPDTYLEGLAYADNAKYQAILPLPFYHVGSDVFTKPVTDEICKLSMVMSYHSGIPIMGNYSGRTSLAESKKSIQLLSPDFYHKVIQEDIKSNKPFLVLYSKEELLDCEQRIIHKSKKVFENDEYVMYSIVKDSLFQNSAAKEIKTFNANKNNLFRYNDYYVSDSASFILINSYENGNSDQSYRGKHSMKGRLKEFNLLQEIKPGTLSPDITYVLSLWVLNTNEISGQDVINSSVFIEEVDKNNNLNWIAFTNPAKSLVIDDNWSMIELPFKISDTTNKLSVYLTALPGNEYSLKYVHIDELLIREENTDFYKVSKENNGKITELVKNNHTIRLP